MIERRLRIALYLQGIATFVQSNRQILLQGCIGGVGGGQPFGDRERGPIRVQRGIDPALLQKDAPDILIIQREVTLNRNFRRIISG